MYVLLPNPEYYFDGQKRLFNNVTKKEILGNTLTIKLYGHPLTKEREWFYLLAKYQIKLPAQLQNRISEIEFQLFPKNAMKNCQHNLTTKKPLLINDTYALSLYGCVLAINNIGMIINIDTMEIVSRPPNKQTISYRKLFINNKPYLIHRLMASAWIWNDNLQKKYIVNHIDGNKSNNVVSNLEWISFSGNIEHAYDSGLRDDNIPILLKHMKEKRVRKFRSLRQAMVCIGTKSLSVRVILNSKLGFNINGYEIRLANDFYPWYYQTGNEPIVPKMATTMYVHADKTYFNLSTICEELNLPTKTTIADLINKFNVKVTDLVNKTKIIVYDTYLNKFIKFTTTKEVIKYTGFTLNLLYKLLRERKKMLYNGYCVMRDGDVCNVDKLECFNKNKKMKITITKDNDIVVYDSVREAIKDLKISGKTLIKYNNAYYNNMHIKIDMVPLTSNC